MSKSHCLPVTGKPKANVRRETTVTLSPAEVEQAIRAYVHARYADSGVDAYKGQYIVHASSDLDGTNPTLDCIDIVSVSEAP